MIDRVKDPGRLGLSAELGAEIDRGASEEAGEGMAPDSSLPAVCGYCDEPRAEHGAAMLEAHDAGAAAGLRHDDAPRPFYVGLGRVGVDYFTADEEPR